jgi:hypothetical protein
MNLLSVIRGKLVTHFPHVLSHIEEQDLSLEAAFSPIFLTISIYHMPLDLAARIFEVFLIEGETFLIRLLMKMVELKQSKIITLTEHELLEYLR